MKEKIILGTAQFGLNYGINNERGKIPESEIIEILSLAYNNDITFLDTAEAYGDAQKRIGKVLGKHTELKFNIITKFFNKNFNGNFRERIVSDLNTLKVNTLYAYFFHNKKDFEDNSEKLSQLTRIKEEGLIKKIGVSLYTNEEVEDVLNKEYKIDIIQLPFNLLDNDNKKGDILKRMKDKGIEVHTRSVFLQGLFFKKDLPENLLPLLPYTNTLRKIAADYSISLEKLAINYCINHSYIDKVLIGVDSKEQLKKNIDSVGKIDKRILSKINTIDVENTQLLNPSNW